jgi:hypothetical protein
MQKAQDLAALAGTGFSSSMSISTSLAATRGRAATNPMDLAARVLQVCALCDMLFCTISFLCDFRSEQWHSLFGCQGLYPCIFSKTYLLVM